MSDTIVVLETFEKFVKKICDILINSDKCIKKYINDNYCKDFYLKYFKQMEDIILTTVTDKNNIILTTDTDKNIFKNYKISCSSSKKDEETCDIESSGSSENIANFFIKKTNILCSDIYKVDGSRNMTNIYDKLYKSNDKNIITNLIESNKNIIQNLPNNDNLVKSDYPHEIFMFILNLIDLQTLIFVHNLSSIYNYDNKINIEKNIINTFEKTIEIMNINFT
jgi:hypothetical protein